MFAKREGKRTPTVPPSTSCVRTVLIALDLLSRDPEVRRHALRVSVLIHASDTASAAMAAISRLLPAKAAKLATAVSAANVVLALIASREVRKR
jgi:hypothetical protein